VCKTDPQWYAINNAGDIVCIFMSYQCVFRKKLFSADGQTAWKSRRIRIFVVSFQRLITLCSLSRSSYMEHQDNISYHVGSSWVETTHKKLQDLGIYNVKSNVHPFARSHEAPRVPTSPRSCRNKTPIARSPLTFPWRDACPNLLAQFPVRIIGFFFFFLLAFPLLVKCHTVFTPHLPA